MNRVSTPHWPIAGIHWTAWGQWSACSVSCGLGTKTTKRSCRDEAEVITKPIPGKDCLGPDTREDECEKGPCPGEIHVCNAAITKHCGCNAIKHKYIYINFIDISESFLSRQLLNYHKSLC